MSKLISVEDLPIHNKVYPINYIPEIPLSVKDYISPIPDRWFRKGLIHICQYDKPIGIFQLTAISKDGINWSIVSLPYIGEWVEDDNNQFANDIESPIILVNYGIRNGINHVTIAALELLDGKFIWATYVYDGKGYSPYPVFVGPADMYTGALVDEYKHLLRIYGIAADHMLIEALSRQYNAKEESPTFEEYLALMTYLETQGNTSLTTPDGISLYAFCCEKYRSMKMADLKIDLNE